MPLASTSGAASWFALRSKAPAGSWQDVVGLFSNPTYSNNWTNYTHVTRFAVAGFAGPASGSKARITFGGPASGSTAVITACYIGHRNMAGDNYDFDGTQVQLTVSGSNSFNLAVGATVVSDEIPYPFNNGQDFLVAYQMTSGDISYGGGGANVSSFYKAALEASTANKTGYSALTGAASVRRLEIFG